MTSTEPIPQSGTSLRHVALDSHVPAAATMASQVQPHPPQGKRGTTTLLNLSSASHPLSMSKSNSGNLSRRSSQASVVSTTGPLGVGRRSVSGIKDSPVSQPTSEGILSSNSFGGRRIGGVQGKLHFDKEDITLEDLKRLKAVFDDAAEAGGGQLSEAEFLTAFAPILAGSMNADQLAMWFKHIDASDDGHVDWDEFSMFLLLSGDKEKSASAVAAAGSDLDNQIFVKDVKTSTIPATAASATSVSGYNHSEMITGLAIHNRLGKYYTGSQDGTVRVWDAATLEFQSIVHNTKAWVTGVCLGKNETRLCVSGVDRVISIYDVFTDKLLRCFVGNTTAANKYTITRNRHVTREEIDLRNLSYAKSRREKLRRLKSGEDADDDARESPQRGGSPSKKKKGSISAADRSIADQQEKVRTSQGGPPTVDVHILRQTDFPAMCLMSAPTPALQDSLFLGLSNGVVQAYGVHQQPTPDLLEPTFNLAVHQGAITSLLWINRDDCFVTTGSDGCVYAINIDKAKATSVGMKPTHQHPIHSSCWLESARLLATSGNDRHISLWSIGAQSAPILLKGHLSSVSSICACEGENYLVSVDVEKCFKIWDLRTMRPVQTTVDYDIYKPMNRMSYLAFDSKRSQIVTGCAAPVAWPMAKVLVAFPDPKYKGHQKPVVSVVFNPSFHKIATADAESVRLWSMETGELLQTWTLESLRATAVKAVQDSVNHYIFEMVFDNKYKRLIIGLTSGDVLVVNFANGQLLTEMLAMKSGSTRREISFSECTDLEHYVGGANKYVACLRGSEVLIWEDSAEGHEKRLDWVIKLYLDYSTYDNLRWSISNDDKTVAKNWRSPLPMCLCAMGTTHMLVGTDAGLILVYGSSTWELMTILGTFEPSANIMCLAYTAKRDLIVAARSDGKAMVYSFGFKDRRGCISLRDASGRQPILQCIDIGPKGNFFVCADEEGFVYVVDITDFDISTLHSFDTVTATIGNPCGGLKVTTYFQAHSTEVLRIALIDWHGSRYISTCAGDCQSRLFTLTGDLVGYCGSENTWDLKQPLPAAAWRRIPAPLSQFKWTEEDDEDDDSGAGLDNTFNGRLAHVPTAMFLPTAPSSDALDVRPRSPASQAQSALASPRDLGSKHTSPSAFASFLAPTNRSALQSKGSVASGIGIAATVPGSTSKLPQLVDPPPGAVRSDSIKKGYKVEDSVPARHPSPPKSRSQLWKLNPSFISPTRNVDLLQNRSDEVFLPKQRAPFGSSGLLLDPSGSGRITIEQQKVRLERKRARGDVKDTADMVNSIMEVPLTSGTGKLPAIAGMSSVRKTVVHAPPPSGGKSSAQEPSTPGSSLGNTLPKLDLGKLSSAQSGSNQMNTSWISAAPSDLEGTEGNESMRKSEEESLNTLFQYRHLRQLAEEAQRNPQTARPPTPIDTKVEMWKSGKALSTVTGSWTARSLTRLRIPSPDEEVKKELNARKHKLPAHLATADDGSQWRTQANRLK